MKRYLLPFEIFFLFLLPFSIHAEIEHEFSPLVSLYTGDALRSSILSSFSYTLHLNSTFWVGVDSLIGPINVDQPNGLGLTGNEKFKSVNGTFYINLPTLLGAKKVGDDGLASDLYTSFGLGYFWFGGQKQVYGFWGGGMLLRTGLKWLGVRFDLKGLFLKLNNSQGSDFNSDLALSLGPTLLF